MNGEQVNGSSQPFNVAIIGGGIVGVILGLGLIRRNVNVTIYEQAQGFREIGAGIVFTPNAVRSMRILDPRIVDALNRVVTTNGGPDNPNDFLTFVDGYNHESRDPNDTSEKLCFSVYTGYRGFAGCHRAHFMDEIQKLMPEGHIVFGKRLDSFVDRGDDSKVLMKFIDGTTAEANAVIACDGIKSRVRQLLLGKDNPASYPHYSHKYAYRGLIPMAKAVAALGYFKAHNQHVHMGPKAHVLSFPVANYALMNVVAFVTDPDDWPSKEFVTAHATKDEVVKAFENWGPAVRAITNLLPEKLEKWGIFDTYDYPAPTFARGRVCLAGDAAHASSPHHGGGAGIGMEDALVLASLMEMVTTTISTSSVSSGKALATAFAAYDPVRRERTQWLVRSSRTAGDLYEWNEPRYGDDVEKLHAETRWRNHKLWHYDIDYMIGEVGEEYKRLLAGTR